MKQYESYKDSGIMWLGLIPSDWKQIPLKYYISFLKGKTPNYTTTDQNGLPYLTMDYLRDRENKSFVYPISSDGLLEVSTGDILVLWDGANAGEFLKAKDGYLGSTMAIINVDQEVYYHPYFYYLLKAIEKQSKDFANGTTIPHFDSSILIDYNYPCPSIKEQQIIASFLDEKVGQIEAVITEKEKVIFDLQNYRKSIISEVVTRGLNPDAPMKDSGIDKYPIIPSHWETSKLKYISTICSGGALSSDKLTDNGKYEVYGGNGYMGLTTSYNTEAPAIVIGRVGALCGNVHLIDSPKWVTDNALVLVINNGCASYNYIAYYLRAYDLNTLNSSNAQPLITGTKVQDVIVPIPPLEEQKKITDYLENRLSVIENSIEELQSQIEDLKSYKSSLITEAVTGKVDLR